MNKNTITSETRIKAYNEVDKQIRYEQILSVLKENEFTAKEIAVEMNKKGYIPTTERNFTAPRLTELKQNGIVEVIGKKRCQYTNKTVSIYKAVSKSFDRVDTHKPSSCRKKIKNTNDNNKEQISFSDLF